MSRPLRIIGITAASVAGVAALLVGLLWGLSAQRLGRTYEVPTEGLTFQAPHPEMAERGRRVAISHACTHCHLEDLRGARIPEFATFGDVVAPNLTRGGAGGALSERDWARAIRYAVGRQGQPLLFMPMGHHYGDMTDEELGAIIAYARSVPPVPDTLPTMRLSLAGRAAVAMQMLPVDAEMADYKVRPYRPTAGVSLENGRYLVQQCTPCHGGDLGGMSMGGRPGPSLTPAGRMGTWTEDDFLVFFQTGRTPDGRVLDPRGMPWKAFGLLREDELRSMWQYLRQVPPVNHAVRRPAEGATASR